MILKDPLEIHEKGHCDIYIFHTGKDFFGEHPDIIEGCIDSAGIVSKMISEFAVFSQIIGNSD